MDSVPAIAALNGDFSWLEERGAPHLANMATLDRLSSALSAVGVSLPPDFVDYHLWSGWAGSLDEVSVTGCWTRLPQTPLFSPAEPGAFLVRFLSDQQDCVLWYLYLRRGEPAFVVHSYGLEDDCESDEEHFGVIYRCAETFEEFAYRFWIENRAWRHLNEPEAGPMPPDCNNYLNHYIPT